MPPTTSAVDSALIYILAFSALLFFAIVFFMIYFLVRYRASRNPVPAELPASPLLEAVWVAVPTILALSMFFYGLTGFRFLRSVPADSMKVKVLARQWSWLFEYDNGKRSPNLVVPAGRNIGCDLVSADVIHGFYIPSLRIQQDMVPGLKGRVWFNVPAPGSHYILCSQYCGQRHSAMLAKVIAVPPDLFEAWKSGKEVQIEADGRTPGMAPGETLLFERGCATCHSLYGGRMAGPTLKGLYGSSVEVTAGGAPGTVIADSLYIRESILAPGAKVTAGFPNTMPSGRDVLTDEEIGRIVTYLKTLR